MAIAFARSRRTVMTNLFDERPVEIGRFRLQARVAVPIGRPSLDEWSLAFEYATSSQEASPYWVGDLLTYADSRAEWRTKLEQAKAATSLTEQTLHNLGYISRHVTGEARELAPTLGHASEVASLDEQDQVRLLTKAKTEGWNVREFRREVKKVKQPCVAEGQADVGLCANQKHDWFDRFQSHAFICRRCGTKGVVVAKDYLVELEKGRKPDRT